MISRATAYADPPPQEKVACATGSPQVTHPGLIEIPRSGRLFSCSDASTVLRVFDPIIPEAGKLLDSGG